MAGLIPQSFIDDLLARADIVDVIDARVTLKKTGKNYSGLCPFHNEKTPSFTVEPAKQFYYCFGCGAGGNVLGFLMRHESLDFPDAIESLASSMGIEVPREESPALAKRRERNQHLYDILGKASAFYQQQLRRHPRRDQAVDYLKKRGLSGEIAREYALGFAPPGWHNLGSALGKTDADKKALLTVGLTVEKPDEDSGKTYVFDFLRERVVFPIRDQRGRVIGFGGRVLGNDKPKYLNSPETPVFHKGEELYGLYEARKNVRKLARIVIVEGYMDVIALAQHDIPYSVATLGTATSERHLIRLFRLVPEVVFCFDGDHAGREAAWRALEQVIPLLEDGRSARFLFLPEGEDPDSQVRKVGTQAFVSSLASARQLAEFFFETLSGRVDMQSLEGRAKLATLAMPYIHKLPAGFLRQLMLDQLASITGLDRQGLERLQGEQRGEPKSAPAPVRERAARPMEIPEAAPRQQAQRPPERSEWYSSCLKQINFILLEPSIVQNVEINPGLKELNNPDIDLLLQIVELAKQAPHNKTHELMARIYATPLGSKPQLLQLLDREKLMSTEGIEREFKEFIRHLNASMERKLSVASLLEKAKQRLNPGRQGEKNANSETNS